MRLPSRLLLSAVDASLISLTVAGAVYQWVYSWNHCAFLEKRNVLMKLEEVSSWRVER